MGGIMLNKTYVKFLSLVVLMAISIAAVGLYAADATPASEPAAAPATGKAVASAPSEAAAPVAGNLAEMWDNLLHFIVIAKPDVALSYGQAILKSNPEPRQIY